MIYLNNCLKYNKLNLKLILRKFKLKMGQNLTCCSNSNVDTTNDFKTNDFKNQFKIPKDKMHYIVRIQAIFRGYLTRERV